jgi:hypothetical protein
MKATSTMVRDATTMTTRISAPRKRSRSVASSCSTARALALASPNCLTISWRAAATRSAAKSSTTSESGDSPCTPSLSHSFRSAATGRRVACMEAMPIWLLKE